MIRVGELQPGVRGLWRVATDLYVYGMVVNDGRRGGGVKLQIGLIIGGCFRRQTGPMPLSGKANRPLLCHSVQLPD